MKAKLLFWPWALRSWALRAVILVAVYIGTAFIVYGFRHPEMTDTQRLLDFWNVLCWR